MQLAFVAFHYFPWGGLTRDMLAMAELCQQRGHDVVIYVGTWHGDKIDHIKTVELVTKRTLSNPGHNEAFVKALGEQLNADTGRTVIGFNKMPHLDFYYAADTCFAAKAFSRNLLYRNTRRARQYLAHEKAVFASESTTHSLMISRREMAIYQRYYDTPLKRLHMLPPGIRKDRVLPDDDGATRKNLRLQYGLQTHQKLLLTVGSDFNRKGVDRAIRGLSALPAQLRQNTLLWIAGQDNANAMTKLATQCGVANQVRFLGARDDVAQLLWAADAFLHPAYSENTGTVILEAMVAGLPALVSDVCGYAHYVRHNNMGEVLTTPIAESDVASALSRILRTERHIWVGRSRAFAKQDIYSMTERATELIEKLGQKS